MKKNWLHLVPLRAFIILSLLILITSTANSQYIPESEKNNPCPYIKTMQKHLEVMIGQIEERFAHNRAEYRRVRQFLEESLETRSAGLEICDEVRSAIACLKEKENARPHLEPGDAANIAQIEKEIAEWKAKFKELNCDGVAGSLHQVAPEILGKSRRESFNPAWYTEYAYTATTAIITIQNDPPDKRVIKWEFSGVPTSLIPDSTYTITISGSLEIHTPGELSTYPSAGIRITGLTMVSAQNAYVAVNTKREGKYVIKVPKDAKSCSIELGADYGLGTFARYRYEK